MRERLRPAARAGRRGRRRPFRRATIFIAKPGAGRSAGRRIARPSARANSALVTGCGAVTLTGPLTAGVSTIQRTISIQSSRWTHGMYWRPDPIGPPAKKRNGRIICGRTPPDFSSTRPGAQQDDADARRVAARCASASHSTQRCARKSSPGRGLFGQRLVAAIAVVADAAAADERGGRVGASRRGPSRASGSRGSGCRAAPACAPRSSGRRRWTRRRG